VNLILVVVDDIMIVVDTFFRINFPFVGGNVFTGGGGGGGRVVELLTTRGRAVVVVLTGTGSDPGGKVLAVVVTIV